MTRIEVLKTFRHAEQTFHAGEVRLVSESDAGYFCGLGWARADGHATGTPDTAPKTLDVHNSTLGHAAKNL